MDFGRSPPRQVYVKPTHAATVDDPAPSPAYSTGDCTCSFGSRACPLPRLCTVAPFSLVHCPVHSIVVVGLIRMRQPPSRDAQQLSRVHGSGLEIWSMLHHHSALLRLSVGCRDLTTLGSRTKPLHGPVQSGRCSAGDCL